MSLKISLQIKSNQIPPYPPPTSPPPPYAPLPPPYPPLTAQISATAKQGCRPSAGHPLGTSNPAGLTKDTPVHLRWRLCTPRACPVPPPLPKPCLHRSTARGQATDRGGGRERPTPGATIRGGASEADVPPKPPTAAWAAADRAPTRLAHQWRVREPAPGALYPPPPPAPRQHTPAAAAGERARAHLYGAHCAEAMAPAPRCAAPHPPSGCPPATPPKWAVWLGCQRFGAPQPLRGWWMVNQEPWMCSAIQCKWCTPGMGGSAPLVSSLRSPRPYADQTCHRLNGGDRKPAAPLCFSSAHADPRRDRLQAGECIRDVWLPYVMCMYLYVMCMYVCI